MATPLVRSVAVLADGRSLDIEGREKVVHDEFDSTAFASRRAGSGGLRTRRAWALLAVRLAPMHQLAVARAAGHRA
jgi:hypothetical protein